MRRPWLAWLLFASCVALAAAAMARVDATARRLARAEATARRQAALEEDLQLALWRMDSALAPLVAEEGTRPYFHYGAFYPAERAYTAVLCEIRNGDVLMPSPLLTYASPRVRLHFQFGPDGRLSSPQVPTGNMLDLAEARYLSPERCEGASRRLDELGRLVRRDALAAALEENRAPFCCPDNEPMVMAESPLPPAPAARNARGSSEYLMRSRNTAIAQAVQVPSEPPSVRTGKVSQGPIRAVWIGPALLLARRVRTEAGTYLQGCWLDWDAIRAELLSSVADLLPHPALEPVRPDDAASPTRTLAAIPARLVPGDAPAPAEGPWSPVSLPLAIAWGGLALAAVAVALLLRGALALSERRGTFVSAVTHELRTPLTTFRLYTEMLDEGMVTDEPSRRSYVQTLRAEADRLGHLVENVLAFARLERGRAADRREVVAAGDMLERLGPPLAARARLAGMELVVRPPEAPATVRTDVSAVGQVLSNLVDNACKYAVAAPDRRISIEATAAGSHLAVAVRDHGPGVSPRAARRLFRPFSKSAHDAARSAPGVGLGLALSRRLARALGGDLRHQPDGPAGACFVLTLPLS
jgi:signal transduction histidine kinase